jgi:hypothetical protein
MTLFVFLSIAVILRLYGFASSNLWADEWITLKRMTAPWSVYLQNTYEFMGFNLWENLLRPFTFGPHWVLRIPALACSIIALWLAWLIMRELKFTDHQCTFAAVILAGLPGLIWMAQDARYYSAVSMLFMASILCALRGRIGWLIVCIIVSFYVHVTGPAYTMTAALIALISGKLSRRDLVVLVLFSALFTLPKLYSFVASDPGIFYWTGPLTIQKFIYEFGQSLTVNTLGNMGILLAFAFCVLLFIAASYRAFKSREDLTLWIMLACPLAVFVFVSLIYQNVITYRTLQPGSFALALLAGRVLASNLQNRLTWIPAAAGIGLLVACALYWDPSIRGGDLQSIADHIRVEWQSGDRIVYGSETAMPMQALLADLDSCRLDDAGCTLDSNRRTWLIWSPTWAYKDITAQTINLVRADYSSTAWQIEPLNVWLMEK